MNTTSFNEVQEILKTSFINGAIVYLLLSGLRELLLFKIQFSAPHQHDAFEHQEPRVPAMLQKAPQQAELDYSRKVAYTGSVGSCPSEKGREIRVPAL